MKKKQETDVDTKVEREREEAVAELSPNCPAHIACLHLNAATFGFGVLSNRNTATTAHT